MKQTAYLTLAALLCAFLAGCSVKESAIGQPEQTPKLIRQIRTDHSSGEVRVVSFFYDDQQRVKQQITTRIGPDTQVGTSIREFTYGNGQIEITTDEEALYTVLLNEEGHARELVSGDRTEATYHYNANGYYYEPEMDGGNWSDYQYLLAGNRCNLAVIKKYGLSQSSIVPKVLFTTTFEYGDLSNDANLNLSYLITQESHSGNTDLLTPMLYGWGGKRDSNLPTVRKTQNSEFSTGQETDFNYIYETDEQGYVTAITQTASDDSSECRYSIAYK